MSVATRAAHAHPLFLATVDQRDLLLAYVRKHLPASLRSGYDPEDIVQDACGEALDYLDSFDPVRDPTGRKLLCTIARRRIIRLMDRHRVERQRPASALGEGTDTTIGLLEQLSQHDHTPDDSAERRELVAAVSAAIALLSPEHAAVIRDRYVERLSSKVIAERTGRTPAAIDKLLQRAIAALEVRLRRLGVA